MRKKPVVYMHRYEKLGVSLWRARFPENTPIELKRKIYREVKRENEKIKKTC